jgi:hypothetical protein
MPCPKVTGVCPDSVGQLRAVHAHLPDPPDYHGSAMGPTRSTPGWFANNIKICENSFYTVVDSGRAIPARARHTPQLLGRVATGGCVGTFGYPEFGARGKRADTRQIGPEKGTRGVAVPIGADADAVGVADGLEQCVHGVFTSARFIVKFDLWVEA